jgi:hypothetical protein
LAHAIRTGRLRDGFYPPRGTGPRAGKAASSVHQRIGDVC